jgi:hypothetical protein
LFTREVISGKFDLLLLYFHSYTQYILYKAELEGYFCQNYSSFVIVLFFKTNNQSGTILARKLKKVLDSQLETDLETQEALRELSKFFSENTLRNRRNLRGEIERQSLNNHIEFLNRFEQVKVSLMNDF